MHRRSRWKPLQIGCSLCAPGNRPPACPCMPARRHGFSSMYLYVLLPAGSYRPSLVGEEVHAGTQIHKPLARLSVGILSSIRSTLRGGKASVCVPYEPPAFHTNSLWGFGNCIRRPPYTHLLISHTYVCMYLHTTSDLRAAPTSRGPLPRQLDSTPAAGAKLESAPRGWEKAKTARLRGEQMRRACVATPI